MTFLKIRDTLGSHRCPNPHHCYAMSTTNPPEAITSPPVRYYGGKWRIASWILAEFPPHVCYCEPFCGAANILFRKEPSKFEVLNDLNDDVINFFDVLRSCPDDLLRAIALTPVSRAEHWRAHERNGDPLERARRFYVRSRQSFGSGEGKWNTGWRYQARDRRGTLVVNEWNNLDHLYAAARRLKHVQIEKDDALRCISRFDTPETLFYVDPPYPMSTRYTNEPRYAAEMSDDQHRELSDLLHRVNGMVLISGYPCDLYDELYGEWRRIEKDTKTNGNNPAVEVLWISPAVDAAIRRAEEARRIAAGIPLQMSFMPMAAGQ